jgi:osmotically inducible protein OsmC
MKRTATAIWKGSGKEGKGELTTQSTTLNHTQYSYKSRFEEGVGTNPEELVAAAHAGCFAMALSFQLQGMGITPDSLEVNAVVTLDPPTGSITSSALTLKAKIPGVTDEQFKQATENAKAGCPISKLLNTKITLDATLV